MRARANFPNAFKLICAVQRRAQKEIGSRSPQITLKAAAIPARLEGRIAIVTDVGLGEAVDAAVATDERDISGRRSRVVLAPRRWR
jgi:hypothetical protein